MSAEPRGRNTVAALALAVGLAAGAGGATALRSGTDGEAPSALDAGTPAPVSPVEQCNSLDDDGDGLTDNVVLDPCGAGEGARRCKQGTWSRCEITPRAERDGGHEP